MSVQWFPGHMHLTRKAMAERVKGTDVVIEMLDARLPGSSANPLLRGMIANLPTLKVLNKQDLADPERTAQWLEHYNAQRGTRALALDAGVTAPARALINASFELAPHRGGMIKPLRILICGIPNVGKSTLINTLLGKRSAKTGDEAGVTRTEQRLVLADDVYLYDTPGVLWPKIIVPESGQRLAASGAVGRNAYEDDLVALDLLGYLKTAYPAQLEAVGRQRGALVAGGKVNWTKAAEAVIGDFRAALLGRITLETPAEFSAWLRSGQRAEAQRLAEKHATQDPARSRSRR